MEKRAKQLEYLITSMILLGIGMLFFFMNESVNTYTVLRFGLFQIMQSVLLLICAILLWYRAYVVRREQETAEGGAETLGAAPAAPEEAGEGAHLLGWILGGLGGVVLLLALATWLL